MKKINFLRLSVRLKWQFEFFSLALGPVVLLTIGVIPKQFRFLVIIAISCIVSFAIYLRMKNKKWGWRDIGIRVDNIVEAYPLYTLFTVIGAMTICLVSNYLGLEHRAVTIEAMAKLAGLSIFVSVLQEFLYRGYLLKLAQDIWQSRYTVILTNIVFFTLLHIFYRNLAFILPLAFVGGIIFTLIYIQKPNLILVSCMHIVLNFTALHTGFFKI